MSHVVWRIRGRLHAYRYKLDMMRREGELTRVEEAALIMALAGAMMVIVTS